ncbi:unnamed protein product [Medioppia subpectinata]|uniref:ABC transporter domain-containing protein n=1 Tax=Medioppia subpectinata TaxID=1979941 RepID=A0A7R9KR47_9ACAR|nr:unnamed protein product [Medioppia subpectinata]CAG2107829.1 unnamed protein product [Medioppia subpectinata]
MVVAMEMVSELNVQKLDGMIGKGGVGLDQTIQSVDISWLNIEVFTTVTKSMYNCYKTVNMPKQLIFNVSGEVKAGQLLAIMGSSGAGKTTLLNVLTTRNLGKLAVNGEVLLNGQAVSPENMASISSYIQQHDMFYPLLTVREHLSFQALLRMDGSLTNEERNECVEHMIKKFNLMKCAKTKIGGKFAFKGISGGEMKRLAFASEVLTNPSLMFCDEPTSGLDSFMAENIVQTLKTMASEGRTIICTIHQPSSQVFELFEHLLLMADGRVAFMGKRTEAQQFFSSIGYAICDEFQESSFGTEMSAETLALNKSNNNIKAIEVAVGSDNYRVGVFRQSVALFWRTYVLTIRNPRFLRGQLFRAIIMGLMMGTIFYKQGANLAGIQNINGAINIITQNNAMMTMMLSITTFCMDTAILCREHHNRMFAIFPYFIATVIIQFLMFITISIVFVVLLYYMIGFYPTATAFFRFICTTVLMCTSYAISSLCSTFQMASTVLGAFISPLVLLSGFYVNTGSVPKWLVWAKYLSFIYYGYESNVVTQWIEVTDIPCNLEPDSTNTCFQNGVQVIEAQNFTVDSFYIDSLAMTGMTLAYLFITYLGLLWKTRKN